MQNLSDAEIRAIARTNPLRQEHWKELVAAFFNRDKFPINTSFETNAVHDGKTIHDSKQTTMTIIDWFSFYVTWSLDGAIHDSKQTTMTIIDWFSFYVTWSVDGVPMVGAAKVPMVGSSASGSPGRDEKDNVYELPIVSVVVNGKCVTEELGLVPGVFPYTVVDGFLLSDLQANEIKQDLPALISASNITQIVEKRILDTHNVHYRRSELDENKYLWKPTTETSE